MGKNPQAQAAVRDLGITEQGWNDWVTKVKKEMPDMPKAAE